jgi:hypothetical protein
LNSRGLQSPRGRALVGCNRTGGLSILRYRGSSMRQTISSPDDGITVFALLLIATAGLTAMTAAQQYWWLAPTVSALALIAIIWFQWGQHKVRAYRLRRPFSAVLLRGSNDYEEYNKLRLPAHKDEVIIHLRVRPRVSYRQTEIVFGFDGDPLKRPLPHRVLNEFIKKGFNREQDPDKNQNHYIDLHNHYHIVATVDRSPPNVQALGFVIQTRDPGRYPIVFEKIIDCGEAQSFIKLHAIVDEPGIESD